MNGAPDRVKLDVGGQVFWTLRSTLENTDSFFRAMVKPNVHDYFIDRDPMHFRHILNYLREAPSFPLHESELRQLAVEADYFCLPDLVTQIEFEAKKTRMAGVAYQLSIIASRMG